MVPQRVPMEKGASFPDPVVYSVSSESSFSELSHETGRRYVVTVHGARLARKACIQWGADWFQKGWFTTLLLQP
jgi:hypothetical protein